MAKFKDLNRTFFYYPNDQSVAMATDGKERLRIDLEGRVLIGTAKHFIDQLPDKLMVKVGEGEQENRPQPTPTDPFHEMEHNPEKAIYALSVVDENYCRMFAVGEKGNAGLGRFKKAELETHRLIVKGTKSGDDKSSNPENEICNFDEDVYFAVKNEGRLTIGLTEKENEDDKGGALVKIKGENANAEKAALAIVNNPPSPKPVESPETPEEPTLPKTLLFVRNDGHTGICTDDPGASLHVKGDLRIDGVTDDNMESALSIFDSTGNPLFLVRNDGHIGIRTDEPEAPLHVKGNVKVDGDPETGGVHFEIKAATADAAMNAFSIMNNAEPSRTLFTIRNDGQAAFAVNPPPEQTNNDAVVIQSITESGADYALRIRNFDGNHIFGVRNDGIITFGQQQAAKIDALQQEIESLKGRVKKLEDRFGNLESAS